MDVNTLKFTDAEFPRLLEHLSSPPKQLYWSGRAPNDWINKPKVAIVGSRKLTPYGKTITNRLAGQLSRAGVVIISGLAYGIDVTAHLAALDAGGLTVAVLPSGLDNIYPPAHAQVAERIRRQGTLLTEYPAGAISFKSNFIIRNRLVSGLSDVVLITEAALKSGSLHTARFALEQGKTVMAVPGNITSPSSEGCNNLIKSGAIPVTDVSDIFFALGIKPEKPRHAHAPRGDARLQAVYELIRDGLSAQEELAAVAKLDGPALAGTLTMLEISGYIRPTGSGNWVVA